MNYKTLLNEFISKNLSGLSLHLEPVMAQYGLCCRVKLGNCIEISDYFKNYEKAEQVVCAKLLTTLENFNNKTEMFKYLGISPPAIIENKTVNNNNFVEKNPRQILNEFLQTMLKESPSVKFSRQHCSCGLSETFNHTCERFAYKLIIGRAQWNGCCSISPYLAKDNSAEVALEELKKFENENDLRLHLGMPAVVRNAQVEVIRQQLKLLRQQYRESHKTGPFYRALGQAYAAIDEIEKELSIN